MDSPGASVRDLLAWTRARLKDAGIEEFQLEGELILQHVLGIDAARMFADMDDAVAHGAEVELRAVTERRVSREPLAYITGKRGFYGRELRVTPDVLIPRQETELLVDLALKWVADHPDIRPNLRIADIGTGSGTLAVTLAAELPCASVDAVDVSPAALEVARGNAEAHGVADRISFHEGDLATPLTGRTYHLVLANLPYVTAEGLEAAQPEVLREPVMALLGGEDGLDLVRRLTTMLPGLMDASGSQALFEIDPLTAAGTAEILSSALPDARIQIVNDLAGLERCVTAELG
ncbi:peptide chain release factor N(5)-glutamine methyltransferase [bacterium]|nr:peptide chain release factor N(5)-glutamine methyltransferase [bacterium]